MDCDRLVHPSQHGFVLAVSTVDSHTAGEATRLIVDGVGPVPGATMEEKRRFLMEEADHFRLLLTREPRGHRDLFAALLTDPCTPGADFGLVYMDARRYPYLCGHATIGAVTTVLELGALPMREPETIVTVDTPSGPMRARARCRDGKVESVAVTAVPSFVFAERRPVDVPGYGRVPVDLVCVGGYFAMIHARDIGLEIKPENSRELIRAGMAVIQAANEQCEVSHPERPEVRTVDVTEIMDEHQPGRPGTSAVVYGEDHMDRSPCGTGTTAKITLLHRQGRVATGETYVHAGPLGTTFEAEVLRETTVGHFPAVQVEIRGSAHITGRHTFLLDPRDPFPQGFLL